MCLAENACRIDQEETAEAAVATGHQGGKLRAERYDTLSKTARARAGMWENVNVVFH